MKVVMGSSVSSDLYLTTLKQPCGSFRKGPRSMHKERLKMRCCRSKFSSTWAWDVAREGSQDSGTIEHGHGLERWDLRKWGSAVAGVALGLHVTLGSFIVPQEAHAVLNAPKALLPRTAETALRRSIPAFNPNVSQIQSYMEDIQFAMRIPQRKPWGTMHKNVQSALDITADVPQMVGGVPDGKSEDAMNMIGLISKALYRLDAAIGQRDQEKASLRVAETLGYVADLELLQAPGLPFLIPKEYESLPILAGRATAEFTVEKVDKSTPFFDKETGKPTDQIKLSIVMDGYSSPISAGNFASNILKGVYDGQVISADRTAIAAGAGLDPNRSIPLEILPAGDFEPQYRAPIDVQSGERPVLPLSIEGAVSMARTEEADNAAAGTEFFIYKFNRAEAGLAGMSFDEGNFGVFGYVVDGVQDLDKLSSGDVIVKVGIPKGADRLQGQEDIALDK